MSHGTYKRTVEHHRANTTHSQEEARRQRASSAGRSGNSQWRSLGAPHRRSLERHATTISSIPDMPSSLPIMGEKRYIHYYTHHACNRFERAWENRRHRMLHRWNLCGSQKRGLEIGKTKRGKGSKIMAITDRSGLPLAISVTSASPHEVTLEHQGNCVHFPGKAFRHKPVYRQQLLQKALPSPAKSSWV